LKHTDIIKLYITIYNNNSKGERESKEKKERESKQRDEHTQARRSLVYQIKTTRAVKM
jgi:hypothetical protein